MTHKAGEQRARQGTPVRVLHVVSELRPKTDTKWLLRLAGVWQRTRHVQMSLAWCYGPASLAEQFAAVDVRCRPLDASGLGIVGGARQLGAIVQEDRVALMHTHLLRADLVGGFVGRLTNTPVLRTAYAIRPYHRERVRPIIDGVLDVLEVRLPEKILAVCEAVGRDCLRRGASREKVSVVRTAGPESIAVSEAARQQFRAEFGYGRDDLVVLTVARLSREKGVDGLIQAAGHLAHRYGNIRWLIVGDGPLRERMHMMIRGFNLADRVTVAGWRDDVEVAFGACDIFCLPSRMEGMPNAVVEAMAAARPIVATRVGGIPEVVRDGSEALLVSPGRPEELAEAIGRLVDDPELRTRIAEAAGHSARAHSVEAAAAAYARIYRSMLTPLA